MKSEQSFEKQLDNRLNEAKRFDKSYFDIDRSYEGHALDQWALNNNCKVDIWSQTMRGLTRILINDKKINYI